MMKKFMQAFLLAIPIIVSAQYKAKSFIMSESENDMAIPIKLVAVRDTTITFDFSESIEALSLSGRATLSSWDTGFIRITLLNENDYEYLVYELYPLLADSLFSTFNRTALETLSLNNVSPRKLKISVKDATLVIDSLHYKRTQATNQKIVPPSETILKEQELAIIGTLNEHLESRQIPWRAGQTSLSWLTYEEKKGIFGSPMPILSGFEYYQSGVFVMPDLGLLEQSITNTTTSPYVSEFDWRNRHGKNWLTPLKDQGWCQSCWIFACIGTIEAYINLYYNRLLHYDLSEQEIMHCGNYSPVCSPGFCCNAYSYVHNYGVVTENCMPYYIYHPGDTQIVGSCDDKCDTPSEIISISENANTITSNITADRLKGQLLHAPFSISIGNAINDSGQYTNYAHSLVLVGYKDLQVGDSICVGYQQFQLITPNSPYVGRTVWVCRENYGENFGENGYVNFILSNNVMRYNYLDCEISSLIYSNDSILITDDDGDGYFFWGVGPKPSSCPSWIPDEADGDDSDYTKGPMDEYGWLRDLNPDYNDTLYIDADTNWNTFRFLHKHVCIRNNATLTIQDTINCYRGVSFTIQPNATLFVDGGVIENGEIKTRSRGNVKIRHNGRIIPCSNKKISVPLGAKMQISFGKIN